VKNVCKCTHLAGWMDEAKEQQAALDRWVEVSERGCWVFEEERHEYPMLARSACNHSMLVPFLCVINVTLY
jgi:hypothetical protein